MGKTSILYQLLHQWTHRNITPVYFEIREESPLHFAERFMTALLCRTPKEKNDQDNPFSNIYETVKNSLNQGRHQEGFMRLLDLVDLYVAGSRNPCVLILDEFHLLQDILGPNTFATLGKKIIIQKQVMYLVASSAINKAKEILQTRLDLLFGQFETVMVGPFSTATAGEFLQSRLGNSLTKPYQTFLITVSGGNPFYLDVFSRHLQTIQSLIPADSLIETFQATLFDSQGILFQYFFHLISRLKTRFETDLVLRILLMLAKGIHEIQNIIAASGVSRNSAHSALKLIIGETLAIKKGSFYFCVDRLFSFWLRSVYHQKIVSSGVDFQIQGDQFQQEMTNWIQQFLQENQKSLHEKVANLLQSFDNDLFEFRGKNFRLPHFQKIEFQVNGTVPHVVAHLPNSKKWNWIIHQDFLTEQDITQLNQVKDKGKQQIQRQIVLALKGIDPNADLLAKETNIWTWNLEELNLIMEAYGKQNLIVS